MRQHPAGRARTSGAVWKVVVVGGLTLFVAITVISPGELAARSQRRTRVERDAGCRFLRVRGLTEDGVVRRRQFSATEILDLELVAGLPASLTGEHRLDVKLYTPDGHLYRVLTVAFRVPGATSDGSGPKAARVPERKKLSGIARPLEVQIAEPLRRRGGASVVRASLPVAGTSIVTSSLYGSWSAVAYLDESTESCTAPREFALTE